MHSKYFSFSCEERDGKGVQLVKNNNSLLHYVR